MGEGREAPGDAVPPAPGAAGDAGAEPDGATEVAGDPGAGAGAADPPGSWSKTQTNTPSSAKTASTSAVMISA